MVSNHVSEGDQCFMCGEDNIHVLVSHHIVPRAYGGSDEDYNRVVLCANHHQAIHGIYTDSVFKRLGVPKIKSEDYTVEAVDADSFSKLPTEDQFEHLLKQAPENTLRNALMKVYFKELTEPEEDGPMDGAGLVGDVIFELQQEYTELPGAPDEKIIERCLEETEWDRETVLDQIQDKRDLGVIYTPEKGYLRIV